MLVSSILLFVCIASAHSHPSFVFVSGWPQSGTSLVQQILTATPNISTMVAGCHEVHGAKCINFNHEGQWLLGKSHQVKEYFHPGEACPIQKVGEVIPPGIRDTLLSEWWRYWDDRKPYLVEKSPQSLVKLFPLQQLVENVSSSTKFLIVLKHPVSLNLAPVHKYHWLHHTESQSVSSTNNKRLPPVLVENTLREKVANLDHFLAFMTGTPSIDHSNPSYLEFLANSGSDDTFLNHRFHNCSISSSWLVAMDYVYYQLQSKKLNARIVRYEDLARPVMVCKRLMKFVFEGDFSGYEEGVQRVCIEQLELRRLALDKRASTATQLANNQAMGGIGLRSSVKFGTRGHRQRLLHVDTNMDTYNLSESDSESLEFELQSNHSSFSRLLRLLNYNANSSSVTVDSKRLRASSQERFGSFQMLVDQVATLAHLKSLAIINKRLTLYGYSLFLSQHWVGPQKQQRFAKLPVDLRRYLQGTSNSMGRVPSSILDPWDLMK